MNDSRGLAADKTMAYRPLYRQVREQLVQRLGTGLWPPGSALPSETSLAAELGVSQGTVRKALDELTAENVLVRRQGRGTFVARHGEGGFLFQFFKLVPDTDKRVFPQSRVISVRRQPASLEVRRKLQLGKGAEAVHVRRVRTLDNVPCVIEDLWVAAALFPGIELREIPNNLYALYSVDYSITIGGGLEKIKAVLLSPENAALLNIAPGNPALEVDRLATSLENVPVEWRVSLCLTGKMHYALDLK